MIYKVQSLKNLEKNVYNYLLSRCI